MKLIRYFFRKMILPIYIGISAVLSLVFSLTARGLSDFFVMLPIILLLLLTIRAYDDISDYEKDREKRVQHLTKKQLTVMMCVLSVTFAVLNVIFFGLFGVISVAVIGYILLQERFEPLKAAFMALAFLYFYLADNVTLGIVQYTVIAVSLLASAGYILYKRGKRK